jgi:D-alanine transaminase
MTDQPVYLNGEILPLSQAQVSVMDRGFLFGDGVYEVIPVFGGRLLRLEAHLERLQNSLDKTGIQNPLTSRQWSETLNRMLEINPGDDRYVYLQVTRGAAGYRDLTPPPGLKPTVFVMVRPIPPVDPGELARGIASVTVRDYRWQNCDIKSISLIANVMLRLEANRAEVVDAIMVRDGMVTEGTASNIFVVHNGIIATPPKSHYLLPGITRDLVLELIQRNGFEYEVRDLSEDELQSADEIWLTSSTREIAPVVELDGDRVGTGAAGPLWHKVSALYQAYKQELRNG